MTTPSSTPAAALLALGACVGVAAAMAVTSRNKTAFESALRQHVFRSISESESRLASKIDQHGLRALEKLNGIDQTQKGLHTVETKLDSLQSIFLRPKGLGTIGECHLERLISDVYPPTMYSFQSTLSNGKRPDCVLKWGTTSKVCIDSKFLLEAFALDDSNLRFRKVAENLKKHLRDVSTKYILPGETLDYAVLFIPSESVYLQIVEEHFDLIVEAHKHKVCLASPTTLVFLLTTLQSLRQDMNIQHNTELLIEEIRALNTDMERLSERHDAAEKQLTKAQESLRKLGVSRTKVMRRRDNLMGVFDDTYSADSLNAWDNNSQTEPVTPSTNDAEEEKGP